MIEPTSIVSRKVAEEDEESAQNDQPSNSSKIDSASAATVKDAPIRSASDFLDDVIAPRANLPTAPGSAQKRPGTTPKPARRPKKLRRLEVESGEVDDEARALASSSDESIPRKARDAACTVTEMSLVLPEDVEEKDDGRTVTMVLPPAPKRSSLWSADGRPRYRRVRFSHVDVFLFERTLGCQSLPTTGDVCLGMDAHHYDVEHHRLDTHVMDDMYVDEDGRWDVEGELPSGERRSRRSQSTPKEPLPGEKYTLKKRELSPAHRTKMLRASGIKITRELLQLLQQEHEKLREQRADVGCSCEGGRCLPESCDCSRDGIGCLIDSAEGPCLCTADSCGNDEGRVEYSAVRNHEHYLLTVARLMQPEDEVKEILPSPSADLIADEDDTPRLNASSISTPSHTIYQFPAATSATHFPVTPMYKEYTGGRARSAEEHNSVSSSSSPVLVADLSIYSPYLPLVGDDVDQYI